MRLFSIISVALLCVASTIPAAEPPTPTKGKSIRDLYAAVNKAFADRDAAALQANQDKNMISVAPRANGAKVLTREELNKLLTTAFADDSILASHKTKLIDVFRERDLALCHTKSKTTLKNGRSNDSQGAALLHRTPDGWQMVFACPWFMDTAIRVEKFSPKSAGKEAGLEKGDVLLRVDGHDIHSLRELQAVIQLALDKNDVEAVVRRNGQEVTLRLKPQRQGVHFGCIFTPGDGANASGDEVDAVRKTLNSIADAHRQRDLKAFEAALSPDGCVQAVQGKQQVYILGRENIIAWVDRRFKNSNVPLDALEVKGINVIQKGDYALAKVMVVSPTGPNKGEPESIVGFLIKQNQQWRVVALLPPVIDVMEKG